MKHFAIVHKRYQNKPIAYLDYDEQRDAFNLRIRKEVSLSALPGLLRLFAENEMHEPGEEWSLRWVEDRIIPRNRQGIGIALRENGLSGYDECEILEKSKGLSYQDELMVIPVHKREGLSPKEIKALRERMDISRAKFGDAMGVAAKTVEAWESGRNIPCPMAMKILVAIQQTPSIFEVLQNS